MQKHRHIHSASLHKSCFVQANSPEITEYARGTWMRNLAGPLMFSIDELIVLVPLDYLQHCKLYNRKSKNKSNSNLNWESDVKTTTCESLNGWKSACNTRTSGYINFVLWPTCDALLFIISWEEIFLISGSVTIHTQYNPRTRSEFPRELNLISNTSKSISGTHRIGYKIVNWKTSLVNLDNHFF